MNRVNESIHDEHVHGDGNQLLLSFFSSSSSSSIAQVKRKERATLVSGEPARPSSTTATTQLLHTVDGIRPTGKKKKWK